MSPTKRCHSNCLPIFVLKFYQIFSAKTFALKDVFWHYFAKYIWYKKHQNVGYIDPFLLNLPIAIMIKRNYEELLRNVSGLSCNDPYFAHVKYTNFVPNLTLKAKWTCFVFFRTNWKPNWSFLRLSWARLRLSWRKFTGILPHGITTTMIGDKSLRKLNLKLTGWGKIWWRHLYLGMVINKIRLIIFLLLQNINGQKTDQMVQILNDEIYKVIFNLSRQILIVNVVVVVNTRSGFWAKRNRSRANPIR